MRPRTDDGENVSGPQIGTWAIGAVFVLLQLFLAAWMNRVQSDVNEIRARSDRVLAIEEKITDMVRRIDRIDVGMDKLLGRK